MNENFILSLMDKFNSSKIDELDFNDGSTRLVLRRGLHGETDHIQNVNTVHLGIPAAASAKSAADGERIKSPIVATYYAAPGPDSPAFVKSGSKVKTGQTLCILEAMKMMNHLEAEFDCEILNIHAANGDLVEYDQDLFTVKRL